MVCGIPYLATDPGLEVRPQGHGQRLRHERSGKHVRRVRAAGIVTKALQPAGRQPPHGRDGKEKDGSIGEGRGGGERERDIAGEGIEGVIWKGGGG